MGLAGNVFLPGAVSDELLSSYRESCDVFVLPSVKEDFDIVFLEAMYLPKTCIGARAGGVSEVIRDGDRWRACGRLRAFNSVSRSHPAPAQRPGAARNHGS
jgi:glycosyltransferase involved in cell wall biosynthesis